MIRKVIQHNFRKAAPEAVSVGGFGRFASEAEARAWWAKHDAENPFGVLLRERFRAHRERIYAKAEAAGGRPLFASRKDRLFKLLFGA